MFWNSNLEFSKDGSPTVYSDFTFQSISFEISQDGSPFITFPVVDVGFLIGNIVDDKGIVLENVLVLIVPSGYSYSGSGLSDENGDYEVNNITIGNRNVVATKDGYGAEFIRNVVIRLRHTTILNFILVKVINKQEANSLGENTTEQQTVKAEPKEVNVITVPLMKKLKAVEPEVPIELYKNIRRFRKENVISAKTKIGRITHFKPEAIAEEYLKSYANYLSAGVSRRNQ
jgi:hypothetical protein